jgi:hypothetical protein
MIGKAFVSADTLDKRGESSARLHDARLQEEVNQIQGFEDPGMLVEMNEEGFIRLENVVKYASQHIAMISL